VSKTFVGRKGAIFEKIHDDVLVVRLESFATRSNDVCDAWSAAARTGLRATDRPNVICDVCRNPFNGILIDDLDHPRSVRFVVRDTSVSG
jgi:hypothetical protein